MSTTKIARNFQLTVPKDIRASIGFEIGDLVNFEIKDGGVFIVPVKTVRKDQSFYWEKRTQENLKTAEKEISNGQTKNFKSISAIRKEFGD